MVVYRQVVQAEMDGIPVLGDHLSHPFPLITTYLDTQSLVSEDSFLLSENRVHECRTKVVDQGDFLLCECLSVRLGPDCRWGGGHDAPVI